MESLVDRLLRVRDRYAAEGGGTGPRSGNKVPYCVLGAARVELGRNAYASLREFVEREQPDLGEALDATRPRHSSLASGNRSVSCRITITNDFWSECGAGELREGVLDWFDDAIRWAKDRDGEGT